MMYVCWFIDLCCTTNELNTLQETVTMQMWAKKTARGQCVWIKLWAMAECLQALLSHCYRCLRWDFVLCIIHGSDEYSHQILEKQKIFRVLNAWNSKKMTQDKAYISFNKMRRGKSLNISLNIEIFTLDASRVWMWAVICRENWKVKLWFCQVFIRYKIL
jgi:hypothetical protein